MLCTRPTLLLLSTLLWFASPALADDRVEDALEAVEAAAGSDPQLSEETRRALRELTRAIREDRSVPPDRDALREAVAEVVAELPEGGIVVRREQAPPRWTVGGDLRVRHESNVRLDGGADDRHRQRIRLRVAGNWRLDDQFDVGARLRTGSRTDSNSPHQTLGEGFHPFEVSLDRAYLHFRPRGDADLNVWAGKFGNPLVTNPVYGELVWDGDVQPEGVAVRHRRELAEDVDLGLAAGQYVVVEQGSGDEASAFVVQTWLDTKVGDADGRLALAWHRFTDLTPDGSTVVLADDQGNAIATRGPGRVTDFVSDFSLLDLVGSIRTRLGDVPATFAAQWIHNLDARISDDTGYALGMALGDITEPGDVRLAYQWQVVEQDAVASAFAGDDFLLPTNQRGHFLALAYQLTDDIDVQLAAYVSELDSVPRGLRDHGTQWRLRLDVNVKF